MSVGGEWGVGVAGWGEVGWGGGKVLGGVGMRIRLYVCERVQVRVPVCHVRCEMVCLCVCAFALTNLDLLVSV